MLISDDEDEADDEEEEDEEEDDDDDVDAAENGIDDHEDWDGEGEDEDEKWGWWPSTSRKSPLGGGGAWLGGTRGDRTWACRGGEILGRGEHKLAFVTYILTYIQT